MRSGPLPEPLEIRLRRRDVSPLPQGALARFQVINRGKNFAGNYRWVLYPDGRLFVAQNNGRGADAETPFDTDLPKAPTKRLPKAVVEQVEHQLREADFVHQPAYQEEPNTEDGDYVVVTARLDGQENEVIYDAVSPAPVPFLWRIE